jgi:hypothetical protein
VLPDNPDYPYQGQLDKYRRWGKIPCMPPAALTAKIPEIVQAVQLVMEPGFTYEVAMIRHRTNIANANVKRSKIPTEPPY